MSPPLPTPAAAVSSVMVVTAMVMMIIKKAECNLDEDDHTYESGHDAVGARGVGDGVSEDKGGDSDEDGYSNGNDRMMMMIIIIMMRKREDMLRSLHNVPSTTDKNTSHKVVFFTYAHPRQESSA